MKSILKSSFQHVNRPLLALAGVILLLALCLYIYSLALGLDKKVNYEYNESVKPPAFSLPNGFYKNEFYLSLKKGHPDDIIYYTLDGAEPTIESLEYHQPIRIRNKENEPDFYAKIPNSPMWVAPRVPMFKGTVVRAISVRGNGYSKAVSGTYFVHPQGRERYTLPVVTLTLNPPDFFGYEKGIYVMGKSFYNKSFYLNRNVESGASWRLFPGNYFRKGLNWERPVYLEYLEQNHNKGFSMNGGIRIHGAITRSTVQKSFRIYLREEYGKQELRYDFFNGKGATTLKTFLLRSSGGDQTQTMFRDALLQGLLENTALDRQAYQPSILFINGEYWGIYNIRERLDPEYLSIKYKLDINHISIATPAWELKKDSLNTDPAYNNLVSFLHKYELRDKNNYDSLSKLIDIDNFIDYTIAQIYFRNTDWPFNNMRIWRYSKENSTKSGILSPKDGRWRCLTYDLDRCFMGPNGNATEFLLNSDTFMGLLFKSLSKNEEYTKKYLDRFRYHLEVTFNTSRVLKAIDDKKGKIAVEMPEHLLRWRQIKSMEEWEKNIDALKDFAIRRPDFVKKELQEYEKKYAKPL